MKKIKRVLISLFDKSKILKSIKQKRYLDFNTLLNETLRKGDKVGYYEIKDKDWIDVGQMENGSI